jgi:glycosyltransferase involved in cell wall biosynthesis
VSDAQIAALYNRADIVIVPSICEGFGLPLLEAMAYGVPVIAANTSSLPEVGGDASLLLDPHSPPQWAAAIERLTSDVDLPRRLAKAGLSRVRQFSWERTSAETLRAIEEVTAPK